VQKPAPGKPGKKKKFQGLLFINFRNKQPEVEDVLERLQKGDLKALEKVYQTHKSPFMEFAKKFSLDKALLEDIYQDAVLAFYENVMKGRFQGDKSSLKTYLFSIGKYMIYKKRNSLQNMPMLLPEVPDDFVWETYEEIESSQQVKRLQQYLGQLGEKCQEIIRMSYFEEKSTEAMVDLLGYPNKETLKSQKSRCLQHLKKMFKVK
jgi:RNA polymerase sigma factor (sigma-70 family)